MNTLTLSLVATYTLCTCLGTNLPPTSRRDPTTSYAANRTSGAGRRASVRFPPSAARPRQPPPQKRIKAGARPSSLLSRDHHHHHPVVCAPGTSTTQSDLLMFRTYHPTRPPDPAPTRGHGTSLLAHRPPPPGSTPRSPRFSCAGPVLFYLSSSTSRTYPSTMDLWRA